MFALSGENLEETSKMNLLSVCQRLLVLGILAAAGAGASPASPKAAGDTYSAAYDACLAGAKGVRPIEHCTAQEIDLQRRLLDARYHAVLAALPPGRRARFVRRQRAWDDAMQARCTVFSRRRGSFNSMKAQACFLDEIIRRRKELARDSE